MSDGLTAASPHAPPGPAPDRARRPAWLVATLQALVIVVVFAAAGLAAGWLWYHLWDVPEGVVSGGQWYTNEAGLRDDFAGVGWYVAISLVCGLVLGTLAAWLLHRSELVTLAAVVAGSALAAYLMLRVGQHLSAPDPHVLARTAQDGTELEGALRLRGWPPRGAFTFGALVGVALVYGISVTRSPAEVGSDAAPDPQAPAAGSPAGSPDQP